MRLFRVLLWSHGLMPARLTLAVDSAALCVNRFRRQDSRFHPAKSPLIRWGNPSTPPAACRTRPCGFDLVIVPVLDSREYLGRLRRTSAYVLGQTEQEASSPDALSCAFEGTLLTKSPRALLQLSWRSLYAISAMFRSSGSRLSAQLLTLHRHFQHQWTC